MRSYISINNQMNRENNKASCRRYDSLWLDVVSGNDTAR